MTALGILILFFSLLSFIRALQRTYEAAGSSLPLGCEARCTGSPALRSLRRC